MAFVQRSSSTATCSPSVSRESTISNGSSGRRKKPPSTTSRIIKRRGDAHKMYAAPPSEDGPKKQPATREEMIDFLRSGCKPKEKWRCAFIYARCWRLRGRRISHVCCCGPKYNIFASPRGTFSPLDADRLTTRALYISDHVLSFFLSFFLILFRNEQNWYRTRKVWLLVDRQQPDAVCGHRLRLERFSREARMDSVK